MNIRTTLITSSLIAASLVSGAAHAALQGRDLNGSAGSFEAYYDTDLDITWLADANYGAGSIYDDISYYGGTTTDGLMTWAAANTWAAQLSFYNPLTNQTVDDWRLPTTTGTGAPGAQCTLSSTDCGHNVDPTSSEVAHLYFTELGNLSTFTASGAESGSYFGGANPESSLDNTGPFTNFESGAYWSGTEYELNPLLAWYFEPGNGVQTFNEKTFSLYALAVRPGDVAAVPEAQTYALMLAGLGLIGWRARRRG